MGMQNFNLEPDCKHVVDGINSSILPQTEFGSIIFKGELVVYIMKKNKWELKRNNWIKVACERVERPRLIFLKISFNFLSFFRIQTMVKCRHTLSHINNYFVSFIGTQENYVAHNLTRMSCLYASYQCFDFSPNYIATIIHNKMKQVLFLQ